MNLTPTALRGPFVRELKQTVLLGWPIIGTQVLWLSMTVVDNILVGRLGEKPLAALAMASTLVSVCHIVIIGVLSALSPMISQAFGAGQEKELGRLARHGLWIGSMLALFAVAVYLSGDPLLRLLGQDPTLTPVAGEYLRAVVLGLPAFVVFGAVRHLTEATSDTIPSVVIAACASAANAVLDLALIEGLWGFPALGVAGAGYATAIVQWIMAIALIAYVRLRARYRQFEFFSGPFLPDGKLLREILRLGVPMAGAILSEMLFFVTSTLLVGTIGTVPLAAHQIALNAASFAFMIPLGLSFAVSIRIGQSAGRREPASVRLAGFAGIVVACLSAGATASAFLLVPGEIASVYVKGNADPALVPTAIGLLRIAGIFQLFDGLQVLGMGMLRGLKDTRVPFLATLAAFWLGGLPVCLGLGFGLGLGAKGIWYGMLVGLGLAATAHQWRFLHLTGKALRANSAP